MSSAVVSSAVVSSAVVGSALLTTGYRLQLPNTQVGSPYSGRWSVLGTVRTIPRLLQHTALTLALNLRHACCSLELRTTAFTTDYSLTICRCSTRLKSSFMPYASAV